MRSCLILGKAEVGSSILPGGTMSPQPRKGLGRRPHPSGHLFTHLNARSNRHKAPKIRPVRSGSDLSAHVIHTNKKPPGMVTEGLVRNR